MGPKIMDKRCPLTAVSKVACWNPMGSLPTQPVGQGLAGVHENSVSGPRGRSSLGSRCLMSPTVVCGIPMGAFIP